MTQFSMTIIFSQIQSQEISSIKNVVALTYLCPFPRHINGRYMVESCHRYTYSGGPVWNGLMDFCELIMGRAAGGCKCST